MTLPIKRSAMNFLRLKFIILYLICIEAISINALHSLQHAFLKFEQQILSNGTTIEFEPIQFNKSIPSNNLNPIRLTEQKPWTFMVYIAADNDLRAFAANNIKQMTSIGSNENINIVVHLDIRLNDNQKITRRYFVSKNKIEHMNQEPDTQKMDSGDPQTLISFCRWAITHYPAENYALILWNHGTGIIDPKHYKIINPAELFMFNPATNKFELDRSIEYLDLFDYINHNRGICFDNTTGNYITNQKLEAALHEICNNIIHDKFKLIGFDACLMSMLEIGNFIKHYAEIMVGSQEVELGTGWNYAHVLQPFATAPLDNMSFAAHIVNVYQLSYQQITNDFTQSAIDLRKIHLLEANVALVGSLLTSCLENQHQTSVKDAIQISSHRKFCTHFDVTSYKDLDDLYRNLLINISKIQLASNHHFLEQLHNSLIEGRNIINQIVIANASGKNLKNAKGISIYFPESNNIQPSYSSSRFSQENSWASFIHRYRS
jgi:hypothetical protein